MEILNPQRTSLNTLNLSCFTVPASVLYFFLVTALASATGASVRGRRRHITTAQIRRLRSVTRSLPRAEIVMQAHQILTHVSSNMRQWNER